MTEQLFTLKNLETANLKKFLNEEFNLDIQKCTSEFDDMQSYEVQEQICKYWALDLLKFYQANKDKIDIQNVLDEYFNSYNDKNIFSIDHLINIKFLINDGINIINFEKIEKLLEDGIECDEDEQYFIDIEKYNGDYECDSP